MSNLKKFAPWIFLGALASLSSACLYTNIDSPSSYRSATPIDVKAASSDPVVQGQGCIYSVLWLVSWGNGSYALSTKRALKSDPQGVLYDVKSDLKVTSYLLGLWTRACTIVTGRAGHV